MNAYEIAKIQRNAIEAKLNAASDAMNAYNAQKNEIGLTPDHIKFSPEYRAAKTAYDAAHAQIRAFNNWFTKAFKDQIRAERRA